MGGGRTRRRMGLALAICAAGSALLCSQALPASSQEKIKTNIVKGKIRSDGTLTAGQPETVTIRNFPRRAKFLAAVEPSPFVAECQNLTQECVPQPIYPIAGTPPFRTKGKGRATITFVMPGAYELFNDVDPTQSHSVSFINGQAVHVVAQGFTFSKVGGQPTFTIADASGRAVAQVPAGT